MKQVLDYIDTLEALIIELQTELCKRPAISPDSDGEGELDKCEFLEAWLRNKGIVYLKRYDAPDARAKGGVRPNLIATIEGKEKEGYNTEKSCFWIMSHMDVVPPGEASLWKTDPWTASLDQKDGKKCIIGRGVEDNQQGLISSVLAALALIKQGIKPSRTVKLLFVSDEENGSNYGVGWLMKEHPELFNPNDSALVPDSGDNEGASIEVAEKNVAWLRFVTHGIQAHGSRPDQGCNAHLAGADFAVQLYYGLTKKFTAKDPLFAPDYSTFQLTKKEANIPNVNTIPAEDVFYYDMRILPCYPIDTVLKEVDVIKAEIQNKYGVTIEYSLVNSMESKPTSADAPLVKLLEKQIEAVYGVKAKPVGIGGGTVAAYLRNSGIDSVVWYRSSDSAHQPNEYAFLDYILGDAKIMALMMME